MEKCGWTGYWLSSRGPPHSVDRVMAVLEEVAEEWRDVGRDITRDLQVTVLYKYDKVFDGVM